MGRSPVRPPATECVVFAVLLPFLSVVFRAVVCLHAPTAEKPINGEEEEEEEEAYVAANGLGQFSACLSRGGEFSQPQAHKVILDLC